MIDYKEIILILGGWTSVLGAIIYFIFNRVAADRFSIKWKLSADQNIAKLQSELAKNNSILNSLISFQGSSHALMQARRLTAIEALWKNVIDYQEILPLPAGMLLNVLTIDQFENYWNKSDKNNEAFNENLLLLKEGDHWKSSSSILLGVDLERPFIGENIWELYRLYTGYVGRISHLFFQGIASRKFYHWTNDELVKHLLETSLSVSEIEYIYSNKYNSYKLTCALIQNKILEEINKITTGDVLTEDALERVKRLQIFLSTDTNTIARAPAI